MALVSSLLREATNKKKWKKQLLLSPVHLGLQEAAQSVYLVAMHLHISREPCGTMTNLTAFTARIASLLISIFSPPPATGLAGCQLPDSRK